MNNEPVEDILYLLLCGGFLFAFTFTISFAYFL